MVVDLSNVPVSLALGDSGIVLGGGPGCADETGIWWKWSSESAFGDGADTREVTGDNANRDGLWDFTTFLGGQLPLIRGSARATSLAALFAAETRMRSLINLTYRTHTVTVPGFAGVFSARRSGRLQWTPMAVAKDGYAYAQFSFTLFCPDSYITAATLTTATLAFPVAGGVDWSDPGPDWSDPGVDWSSSDAASSVTLVNPGPPVPLMATLTAPVTTATFTLQQGSTTQVQRLSNTDSPGLDLLTTGQTFVVDNATGSARMNGSGRNSWVSGDLLLVPTGTSTLYLDGLGTGNAVVSFAPARP